MLKLYLLGLYLVGMECIAVGGHSKEGMLIQGAPTAIRPDYHSETSSQQWQSGESFRKSDCDMAKVRLRKRKFLNGISFYTKLNSNYFFLCLLF